MTVSTFVALVTGYVAVGRTTLGPRLADERGAIWISRDTVHGSTARILLTRPPRRCEVSSATPRDSRLGADNPGQKEGG